MAKDVYDAIRSLISNGTFIGGDVLPESGLAERLGVSRTPVRDALRRLQTEGIIQREAFRRAVVVDMDPNEVIHIFTARASLEPILAELAAEQADRPFLDFLHELHEQMTAAVEIADPDRRGYRELNALFHRNIWLKSGNSSIYDMTNSITRKPIVSPTFNKWTPAELSRSNRQHAELIDALESRDREWAHAAMRNHLLSARSIYRRIGSSGGAQ